MARWIKSQERPIWGRKLRFLRQVRELRLKDVTEATGIAIQTLSGYETGRYIPELENILRLLKFYQVKFEDIFVQQEGESSAKS